MVVFLRCESTIPISYCISNINQSVRGNKKLKPEFSWISGGGSMSAMSICSIDFDKSSTENGILQKKKI